MASIHKSVLVLHWRGKNVHAGGQVEDYPQFFAVVMAKPKC